MSRYSSLQQTNSRKRPHSAVGIQFETEVPQALTDVMAQFQASLEKRQTCILCRAHFTTRTSGSLACRYHPIEYFNRGTNLLGRYTDRHTPPNSCTVCAQLHLDVGASTFRIEPREFATVGGCTRIDHCTSVGDLFARPFIAMPTMFLDELHLTHGTRALIGAAGADNDVVLAALRRKPNVLLVSKARQLAKTLEIDLPGTRAKFTMRVADVYEAMAATFSLKSLEDDITEARALDPMSRSSKHGDQYDHADARRKDRLRTQFLRKVLFAPFVIVARVEQVSPGSTGMRLVAKPHTHE